MLENRLLVVEDDQALTQVLTKSLQSRGFQVRCVADERLATKSAEEFAPHLVLLDLDLQGASGFDLLRVLRRARNLPVILLATSAQMSDKLRGLRLGADDYITKPFDEEELLARVRAVLRRAWPVRPCLSLGDVTVDFTRLEAARGRHRLILSHRECAVLGYLAERRGTVVTRDDLLRDIWGYSDSALTRAVDHAIARLRKKLEDDPSRPRFIQTVHGDGYSLSAP